jgi:hypothetical protein
MPIFGLYQPVHETGARPTYLYPHSEEGRKGPEVLIERYDLADFSSGPTPSSRSRWRQLGNEGFEDQ